MDENEDPSVPIDETMATFEGTAQSHLIRTWSATPAQRLAWLEEAIELAHSKVEALPQRNSNGSSEVKKSENREA